MSGGLSSNPWIDLAVLLSFLVFVIAPSAAHLPYLLRQGARSEAHLALKQLQAFALCERRASSSADSLQQLHCSIAAAGAHYS